MEFDWKNPPFECTEPLTQQDIEESFEDPFAVRLLPNEQRFSVKARFFNLGRSLRGVGVFSYYRANGKMVRVIYARPFGEEENFFYQRKLKQNLMS